MGWGSGLGTLGGFEMKAFLRGIYRHRYVSMTVAIAPAIVGGVLWSRTGHVQTTGKFPLPCRWESETDSHQKGFLPWCNAMINGGQQLEDRGGIPPGSGQTSWHAEVRALHLPGEPAVAGQPGLAGDVITGVTARVAEYVGLKYDTSGKFDSSGMKGLYQGYAQDPFCPATSPNQETYCDLNAQDASMKSAPEVDNNRAGAWCGANARVTVDVGKQTVQVDMRHPNAAREGAWVRGGFIQALRCHTAAVLSQARDFKTHEIELTDPTSIKIMQELQKVIDGLGESYQESAGNKNDVLFCDWNHASLQSAANDARTSRLVEAHQCAAQVGIRAAFQQVLVHEIFSRAQKSYFTGLMASGVMTKELNTFSQTSGKTCENKCKGSTNLNACAQSCYEAEIRPFLASFFNKKWPNPTEGSSKDGWVWNPRLRIKWPLTPGGKCE